MSTNAKNRDFFSHIEMLTETYLTRRRMKRRIKKEKRAKNQALDWLGAFLWAAGMVLLINQYLVQAYRIPSGSMIDTLNIGDHVFVNKIVYGPELLPGVLKLTSPIKPKRNDIIIFENPSYLSRGPVFDVAQRVIFMLTLSIVDIDRDDTGGQRVHFLIKRMAAAAGDRVVMENGDRKIKFAGEDRWVDEREYNARRGWNHNITRQIQQDQYPSIIAGEQAVAWMELGLSPPKKLLDAAAPAQSLRYSDYVVREGVRLETLRKASPQQERYAAQLAKNRLGWYIPEGRVFPMGDNRDSSRDGREFGPVKISKVLGKGMIIYWPYWRMGRIK